MPLTSDGVRDILDAALATFPDEKNVKQLAVVVARIAIGEKVIDEVHGDIDTDTRTFLELVNRMIAMCGIFSQHGDVVLIVDNLVASYAFSAMNDVRDACRWLWEHWDKLPDAPTKRNKWERDQMMTLITTVDEQLAKVRAELEQSGRCTLYPSRFKMFGIMGGSFWALAMGDTQALAFMNTLNPLMEHLRVHARVAYEVDRVPTRDSMPES